MHEQLHKSSNQLDFILCAFNLSQVWILEMWSIQIQFWSTCHFIDHGLYESLLFKNITRMFIALKICSYQFNLLLMVLILIAKALIQYFEPIDAWVHIPQIIIQKRFCLVNIKATYFEYFLFNWPHINECSIIEHMNSKVVHNEIQLRILVFVDWINTTNELAALLLLSICVSSIIDILGNLLTFNGLAICGMELGNNWASWMQIVLQLAIESVLVDIH